MKMDPSGTIIIQTKISTLCNWDFNRDTYVLPILLHDRLPIHLDNYADEKANVSSHTFWHVFQKGTMELHLKRNVEI